MCACWLWLPKDGPKTLSPSCSVQREGHHSTYSPTRPSSDSMHDRWVDSCLHAIHCTTSALVTALLW